MIARLSVALPLVICLTLSLSANAQGGGLLDGRVYAGMIGPVENPDLSDKLFFGDGHFWSEICTRCGFVPGPYDAAVSENGISFSGTLESETRGSFAYEGIVRNDGSMSVSIEWKRRRWYWTSTREIAFTGERSSTSADVTLEDVERRMEQLDFDSDPACARF